MKNLVQAASILVLVCLVGPFALAQQQAAGDQAQMKAYVDMMRKDIRSELRSIVDQAMDLEPANKAKFWGVYGPYETDLKSLWDRRVANIKKYAENYQKLTGPVADELAATSMSIEQDQLALRKKYHAQMKAALGPVIAARFLQVEMMIGHLLGLQIGAQIPLIE